MIKNRSGKFRISFSYRLFISFVVIIAVSIGTLSAVLYRYMAGQFRKQLIQDRKQSLLQVTDHISNIQDTVAMTVESISVSNELQQMMRENTSSTTFRRLVTKSDIRRLLSTYQSRQPYFEDILIASSDGAIYSSNLTEELADLQSEPWYQMWDKRGIKQGFSGVHYYYSEQGQCYDPVVSFISSFRDLTDLHSIMGQAILHVNVERMISSDPAFTATSHYTLYDGSDNLVFGNALAMDIGRLREGEDNIVTLQDGSIVLKNDRMKDGWILTSVIPARVITDQMKPVATILIVILVVTIVIMSLALFIALRHFTKPMVALTEAASMVGQGNLDFHLDIQSGDEFGFLGDTFNDMTASIRDLLDQSVAYEKQNKENEINRLMLQINPHFIYNTLNSIVYLARTKRNDDIIRYTNAFISLLQDTLYVDVDNVFISIAQEMKNIRNYIELQDIRYPDRIRTSYHYSGEMEKYAIPNVFIQPIVENAIFHGLAVKPEGGNLVIAINKMETEDRNGEMTADDEEPRLCIIVKDDGVGMEQEKADQLLMENVKVRGSMRTIGLANIKNRIHHIYGDKYGIRISSSPGAGTTVTMEIPARLYEDFTKSAGSDSGSTGF